MMKFRHLRNQINCLLKLVTWLLSLSLLNLFCFRTFFHSMHTSYLNLIPTFSWLLCFSKFTINWTCHLQGLLADSTCFFVRFLSEPQYNAHGKLFGTPLVTFLSLNSKTGLVIHSAVRSLLAPLLRANVMPSCTGVKTGKENECGPSLDAIVLSDNGIHCSKENLSNSQMELEDTSNCFPALQLALADGDVIVPTTVDVQNTCPGSALKIMMSWSDKLHGIYDFHFLEDLPEVFKSGFMLKKTRQEAVTLYSCLEAFLKEEPLGPDDMWLVLLLH